MVSDCLRLPSIKQISAWRRCRRRQQEVAWSRCGRDFPEIAATPRWRHVRGVMGEKASRNRQESATTAHLSFNTHAINESVRLAGSTFAFPSLSRLVFGMVPASPACRADRWQILCGDKGGKVDCGLWPNETEWKKERERGENWLQGHKFSGQVHYPKKKHLLLPPCLSLSRNNAEQNLVLGRYLLYKTYAPNVGCFIQSKQIFEKVAWN